MSSKTELNYMKKPKSRDLKMVSSGTFKGEKIQKITLHATNEAQEKNEPFKTRQHRTYVNIETKSYTAIAGLTLGDVCVMFQYLSAAIFQFGRSGSAQEVWGRATVKHASVNDSFLTTLPKLENKAIDSTISDVEVAWLELICVSLEHIQVKQQNGKYLLSINQMRKLSRDFFEYSSSNRKSSPTTYDLMVIEKLPSLISDLIYTYYESLPCYA